MTSFGLGSSNANGVQNGSAPPDQVESCTPWTAASEGNLALLQASLQQLNLAVSTVDENGYSLLHSAASYNQVEIMRWLLQHQPAAGAVNVNAADSDGDTPLHHTEKVEAARFLVEIGRADPNVQNREGLTALASKEKDLADEMDEDNEDDDDMMDLKAMIAYLKSVTTR
uniref:Uncharacterized protein n=1 Tax=Grammatophora oceanica TaxID=210454 RepID=A0A7S1UWS1_9STRA|mmetsp:Transcript_27445/g.40300  ORF Transcript_27445/g.40300 Transcript_27445/m.40300 type:complete len:170 (+) Transcript_27445:142-651(+)|eukprot:CAMPEP_0194045382 /NCGR_PEP_ID=MMETSP0009_2-20130614/16738_1 /TAXON_ID=210454 /ORGANISM="Grammatophora oceanica, Strain CCMP 410" /LENGTH=169 /DNA_ID=CAMNT_0038690223 /DNA_START=121 /DNA_END=630 /DNA_ORIENTATION=+